MSVELTPSGARGRNIPRLPRPVMKMVQLLLSIRVRMAGGRLLNLTTAGSRTGKLHTVPLSCFQDKNGAWLVVASFGGTAKHPAWYVNMAHHPDQVWMERGKQKTQVVAESLNGEERAAAWRHITAAWPGYLAYQEQTDREIPVVRLTPVGPERRS
ncbi:MAG TPA: nitroreductase/quinone reductase family protein [Chloroflexia bacterium]|nr:nitroreductase/quinone reductase family protein [Chloroflexia bacterium]